jgi:hypothetical protein
LFLTELQLAALQVARLFSKPFDPSCILLR